MWKLLRKMSTVWFFCDTLSYIILIKFLFFYSFIKWVQTSWTDSFSGIRFFVILFVFCLLFVFQAGYPANETGNPAGYRISGATLLFMQAFRGYKKLCSTRSGTNRKTSLNIAWSPCILGHTRKFTTFFVFRPIYMNLTPLYRKLKSHFFRRANF